MPINNRVVELSPGQEKQVTTNKNFRLGQRAVARDGEAVFRYCRAGAALLAGQLCQHASLAAIGLGLTVADTVAPVPDTVVALGSRTILMDLPSTHDTIDADAFQDGILSIMTGPGAGHMHRMSTHAAVAVDDATQFTITLYDDDVIIDTPLTTASQLSLYRNFYDSVVPVDIDTTYTAPMGVAPAEVASLSFFWLQTWGPCAVRAETGTRPLQIGQHAVPALSTSGFSGAVEAPQEIATALDVVDTVNASGWALPKVGFAIGVITGDTPADDFTVSLFLTLAP